MGGRLGSLRPGRHDDAAQKQGDIRDTLIESHHWRKLRSRPIVRRNSWIFRRYKITQEALGQGGHGKVYVAQDHNYEGRLVAIKVLHKVADSTLDEFEKEVQIMRKLDHPCIARVFEAYAQEGAKHMFIVMEYLEGGDLFDRLLEASGHLDVLTVIDVVKQAASALKYAHKRHIAHRDIKPENICFCSAGSTNNHVKLIDWGLAQYLKHGKIKSDFSTYTYAAPEVLMQPAFQEGYTNACDVWSLGVLTYVLLSGKAPFWGDTKQALQRMCNYQFPLAGGIWDEVPSSSKDLIVQCLHPDPSERISIDHVLDHPWLRTGIYAVEPVEISKALNNMIDFSSASQFFTRCVASVVQQLDYRGLQGIHKVFCAFDTKCEGVISAQELREGFVKSFGYAGEELKMFDAVFCMLDTEGCGEISYSAFCAGGLGDKSFSDEHALWAAFKSFDVADEGHLSVDDLRMLCSSEEVRRIWPQNEREGPAVATLQELGDSSSRFTFQDWLTVMQQAASLEREQGRQCRSDDDSPINFESLAQESTGRCVIT